MYEVALRDDIRNWVLVQGHSQRSAAREFGVSRHTVTRMLKEPPEGRERRYQRSVPREKPVASQVLPHIDRWLEQNKQRRRDAPKQIWTAHRMWLELRRMGIPVGESTVRQLVRERKRAEQRKPAYIPLRFEPGECAQFDFGFAKVLLDGKLVEFPFFAGRLWYSGAMWIEFFPTANQEAFLLGIRHFWESIGGVTRYAILDNLKDAVAEILKGHSRRQQKAFRHFASTYLFEPLFANVRAGNEKGSVENLVGYARRNYMVPLPEGPSLEAINAELHRRCVEDLERTMAGKTRSIADLLAEEQAALRPLPERPVEVGSVREVLVSSTGRVRFQRNRYSVPIGHAHERLSLKADPFRVRIYAGQELVADHPRSYRREDVIEDWRHYVPLLLQKPFAIPFASALRRADLPRAWETFRRGLVERHENGNREFARVLELGLDHSVAEITAAIERALRNQAFSADAVRQLLTWASEAAPATEPLDPEVYPHYQLTRPAPDVSRYNRLLEGVKA